MKLEFSRQIFQKKHSSIIFHENPSIVVPCDRLGRRAGHDERNSRLSLFCERAENYVSWILHHKDILTFLIIIVITTIIIIIIKVYLGLNTFASHVGILSILPKTSLFPSNPDPQA
jgi:hypothetical protein